MAIVSSAHFSFCRANNHSIKNPSRNPSKRSANVIIMRDDGELRLFLPHSTSATNGSRKTSNKSKQDSANESSNHRTFGGKRQRERHSLPTVHRQLGPTSALNRHSSNNASSSSAKNQPPNGRRPVSNYRPVRGADGVGIDSAEARRNRYAYSSGDRTSIL